MGVLKKYRGCATKEQCQILMTNVSGDTFSVKPFKDITGASYNSVVKSTLNWAVNSLTFSNLVPIATADDISAYNFEDYEIVGVGTTSYTQSVLNYERIFNITISNNGNADITAKCIKFQTAIGVLATGVVSISVLAFGYYLDTPLIIPAGQSKTLTIAFEPNEL